MCLFLKKKKETIEFFSITLTKMSIFDQTNIMSEKKFHDFKN